MPEKITDKKYRLSLLNRFSADTDSEEAAIKLYLSVRNDPGLCVNMDMYILLNKKGLW